MEVRRACKRSQSSQLQLSSASSDRNINYPPAEPSQPHDVFQLPPPTAAWDDRLQSSRSRRASRHGPPSKYGNPPADHKGLSTIYGSNPAAAP